MCFTVHIVFINFDNHSPDLGRETCLAPEGFKRSFSGPWPKKVVHHWCRAISIFTPIGYSYSKNGMIILEMHSYEECISSY